MKRFFFILLCAVATLAEAQVNLSVEQLITQARMNFVKGNLDAAHEYATLAQKKGSTEAALIIAQIDYKNLEKLVDEGRATEGAFSFFRAKYKGTDFGQQGERLYQEWKGETPTPSVQEIIGTQPRAGLSTQGNRAPMHFDRAAYERKNFGPLCRVGLSGDFAFGCNLNYAGGLAVLLGRTKDICNLLVGLEIGGLSHSRSHYDAEYDEYYSTDEPVLRARRLNIPVELQFNVYHRDNTQRAFFGLGIDYQRNTWALVRDKAYGIDFDCKDAVRRHTADFRLSAGYGWRHVEAFCFMKVMFKHPFDNDIYLKWYENDEEVSCALEDYDPSLYDQLHRHVSGGIGVRVWL